MMPERAIVLQDFDSGLHLKLLRDWLHMPHVARWWGSPEGTLKELFPRPDDSHAVIVADGVPVGYICWQRPAQDELEAAGLTDLPDGLIDIDILIGEPEAVGQGVGPQALALVLERLREDPLVTFAGGAASLSNERSIRAFEKAGFRQFRDFEDPESGPCRYMVVELRKSA